MNFRNSAGTSVPAWWAAARQQGLVQDETVATGQEQPSFWIVALAMLGAALCTIPLLGLVLVTGIDFWWESGGAYVLGLIGMGVGGLMLRKAQHVFASCMGLVLWSGGQGLLALQLALSLDGSERQLFTVLSGCLALAQAAGAALAGPLWVRQVMAVSFGASAYGFGVALLGGSLLLAPLQPAAVLLALAWGFWIWREPQHLRRGMAPWAACADAAIVGLLCTVLSEYVAPAFWLQAGGDRLELLPFGPGWNALAVLLTLAAGAALARRWQHNGLLLPGVRGALVLIVLLLAAASWFQPALAVPAVVGFAAAAGARWRILALCGLGMLWLLGRFYYSLQWPLALKGLGLAVLGAALLLGLLAQRWLRRGAAARTAGTAASSAAAARMPLAWLALGAVLAFGLVNWDVRGKEAVMANGQPLLVPLAPVDPRSLMQGDYMSLNFDIPAAVRDALDGSAAVSAQAVARRDAQGRARIERLARPQEVLAADELLLPLRQLKGRWTLVTDAFFFAEGRGEHFARARFGDFRVLPDGRALLVGLADEDGKPL